MMVAEVLLIRISLQTWFGFFRSMFWLAIGIGGVEFLEDLLKFGPVAEVLIVPGIDGGRYNCVDEWVVCYEFFDDTCTM